MKKYILLFSIFFNNYILLDTNNNYSSKVNKILNFSSTSQKIHISSLNKIYIINNIQKNINIFSIFLLFVYFSMCYSNKIYEFITDISTFILKWIPFYGIKFTINENFYDNLKKIKKNFLLILFFIIIFIIWGFICIYKSIKTVDPIMENIQQKDNNINNLNNLDHQTISSEKIDIDKKMVESLDYNRQPLENNNLEKNINNSIENNGKDQKVQENFNIQNNQFIEPIENNLNNQNQQLIIQDEKKNNNEDKSIINHNNNNNYVENDGNINLSHQNIDDKDNKIIEENYQDIKITESINQVPYNQNNDIQDNIDYNENFNHNQPKKPSIFQYKKTWIVFNYLNLISIIFLFFLLVKNINFKNEEISKISFDEEIIKIIIIMLIIIISLIIFIDHFFIFNHNVFLIIVNKLSIKKRIVDGILQIIGTSIFIYFLYKLSVTFKIEKEEPILYIKKLIENFEFDLFFNINKPLLVFFIFFLLIYKIIIYFNIDFIIKDELNEKIVVLNLQNLIKNNNINS